MATRLGIAVPGQALRAPQRGMPLLNHRMTMARSSCDMSRVTGMWRPSEVLARRQHHGLHRPQVQGVEGNLVGRARRRLHRDAVSQVEGQALLSRIDLGLDEVHHRGFLRLGVRLGDQEAAAEEVGRSSQLPASWRWPLVSTKLVTVADEIS